MKQFNSTNRKMPYNSTFGDLSFLYNSCGWQHYTKRAED